MVQDPELCRVPEPAASGGPSFPCSFLSGIHPGRLCDCLPCARPWARRRDRNVTETQPWPQAGTPRALWAAGSMCQQTLQFRGPHICRKGRCRRGVWSRESAEEGTPSPGCGVRGGVFRMAPSSQAVTLCVPQCRGRTQCSSGGLRSSRRAQVGRHCGPPSPLAPCRPRREHSVTSCRSSTSSWLSSWTTSTTSRGTGPSWALITWMSSRPSGQSTTRRPREFSLQALLGPPSPGPPPPQSPSWSPAGIHGPVC